MDKNILPLNDFVLLMFTMLAKNTNLNNIDNTNKKIVFLPFNYKQIIENILCADIGWREKFSILIDVNEYFDDHFYWEMLLGDTIENVLKDFNKNIKYNFVMDRFEIMFEIHEIDGIINKYKDENLINTMKHFTGLLTDYIYTREFQENFCDYSARAVAKMKKLNEEKYANEDAIKFSKKKRKLSLFRKN